MLFPGLGNYAVLYKMLVIREAEWGICRNSVYYFCNISVNLKLVQNKLKILLLKRSKSGRAWSWKMTEAEPKSASCAPLAAQARGCGQSWGTGEKQEEVLTLSLQLPGNTISKSQTEVLEGMSWVRSLSGATREFREEWWRRRGRGRVWEQTWGKGICNVRI